LKLSRNISEQPTQLPSFIETVQNDHKLQRQFFDVPHEALLKLEFPHNDGDVKEVLHAIDLQPLTDAELAQAEGGSLQLLNVGSSFYNFSTSSEPIGSHASKLSKVEQWTATQFLGDT